MAAATDTSAMDLESIMSGLTLNKDNLDYQSILRLQEMLADGMRLHDPAQADAMAEVLAKMRLSSGDAGAAGSAGSAAPAGSAAAPSQPAASSLQQPRPQGTLRPHWDIKSR